jgi:hypothetical protein
VFSLCCSRAGDKSEELTALLQDHPEVDVNLYRNVKGCSALHIASIKGDLGCTQVLIGHGADLEARTEEGDTPVILASHCERPECLKVLIEAKADVHAKSKRCQAIHAASKAGKTGCMKLLIHEGADVNAQTNEGSTPLMSACKEVRLTCLQLLLDAKADINTLCNNYGPDALYWVMRMPRDMFSHRVPGMPFSVLSCNTNTTDIRIDGAVAQAMVDGHIAEYKAVHAFIDEHHSILKHALSRDVQVDRRVGLGEDGIYLSM